MMEKINYNEYYHIYNRGINSCDIFKYDNDLIGKIINWDIKLHDEIDKSKINQKLKQPTPSKQFSHLFNAYAKYFNLKNNRTGSLLEKNFKRKPIYSDEYFKYMVYYIHHNPVHHEFKKNLGEYKWTSYNDYISENKSFIKDKEVVELYDDLDNFIHFHNEEHNLSLIDDYILE